VSSSRLAAKASRFGSAGLSAGLAVLCMALCTMSALATDYQINPRLELAGGYDDNVNLGTGTNEVAAGDAQADARVELLAQEPNWRWRATPEVRGNWYPDHSDFDSNAEFLYLDGERSGARYTLDFYGYGASQSLITNYLPTANIASGLGVSQPGTTLATPASIRQDLGYLRPSYALEMTPRSSLELNLDYTVATYSQEVEGYTNYRNVAGAIGLALKATPTGTVTLRATGANFQPDLGRETDTYGADVQWDGKLSATEQYYLRVGALRTDLTGYLAGTPAASTSTTTASGGAGAQWTFTLTEIFVDLTRDVEPIGLGYVVDRDQLRLRVARRFTPRLAGFLGARAIHDDPVTGSVPPTVAARRYNYGTVGFEWRVGREFSVIGAYDFTDYHQGGPTAQANAGRVSLVYEPHRPENSAAITVGY
jgi:hypothetical protein